MANVQYYDVILKPVVTEKSMNAMTDKKYTFLVHTEANKTMIKEAVEKMFPGTKVKSVNTMNMDGKTKRRGMTFGKTAATKKGTDVRCCHADTQREFRHQRDRDLRWFIIHPQ